MPGGFGTTAPCTAGVCTGSAMGMGLSGKPRGTRLYKETGTRPRLDTEQVKLPMLGIGGPAPMSNA